MNEPRLMEIAVDSYRQNLDSETAYAYIAELIEYAEKLQAKIADLNEIVDSAAQILLSSGVYDKTGRKDNE